MIYKNVFIIATLMVFLFLQFSFNFIWAVNHSWFENFQVDSDQIIKDTIQYFRTSNDFYSLILNESMGTLELQRYRPQIGLQGYIFHIIDRSFSLPIAYYYYIVSAISSITLVLFCRELGKILEIKFHYIVIWFGLSPWLIVMMDSLYWVPFTFFLPKFLLLRYLQLASSALTSKIMYAIFLYISLVFKFACGYEFVPILGLTLVAYVFLVSGYRSISFWDLWRKSYCNVFFVTFIFLFAFISTFAVHTIQRTKYDLQVNNVGALSFFVSLAEKRIPLGEPSASASRVCGSDASCYNEIKGSLESDKISVAARYTVLVDFLPFVSNYNLQASDRSILKSAASTVDIGALSKAFWSLDNSAKLSVVGSVISAGCFFVLLMIAFTQTLRENVGIKIGILLSIFGFFSWVQIATGHAAQHYHINYFTMYFSFMPLLICMFLKFVSNRN